MSRPARGTDGQTPRANWVPGWANACAFLLGRENASSLAEFAFMLPFLGLMLVGVIDFGRAYYLSIEVKNAAYAGAFYGARNSTDTDGMESAATADAPDVRGITASATYGCECSDGTNQSVQCASPPRCSTNVINYVTVTTTATYKPLFPWPGIPSPLQLQGSATLRASQ